MKPTGARVCLFTRCPVFNMRFSFLLQVSLYVFVKRVRTNSMHVLGVHKGALGEVDQAEYLAPYLQPSMRSRLGSCL